MTTFAGFGPNALPFFRALAFHQSREWFEANRDTYESAIRGPMGDFVEEVAERLRKAKVPIKGDRKSSLFRIHRDVRFSASKDPYKTNSGAVMTRSGGKNDPGLLYFHLSPEDCFFAAGFYQPELRSACAAARGGRALAQGVQGGDGEAQEGGARLVDGVFAQARAARLRRRSTIARSPPRSASRA